MKPSILRRAVLAGAIATSSMIGITVATPAHAQFGGIQVEAGRAGIVDSGVRILHGRSWRVTRLRMIRMLP